MGQESERIERDIENARSRLGENLREIEFRVREAGDWKTYVRRQPLAAAGAAFGGGLLLALMSAASARVSHSEGPPSEFDRTLDKMWTAVKSAAIGALVHRLQQQARGAFDGSRNGDYAAAPPRGYAAEPPYAADEPPPPPRDL